MATLADLKTRIITELNRDDMGTGEDLETALATAIDRAIEYYADTQFWFNRASGTATTVASTDSVDLPTGIRIATQISYLDEPLIKCALEDIETLSDTGIPTRWAEDGDTIRLWPIPDGAYDLAVFGIAELGTPVTSNGWTVEAYDLIAARAKMNLLRFPLRDPDGYQLAALEEMDAKAHINRESRRRRETPLRSKDFKVARFNINRGW